ncbi:hypothetical protein ACHAXR_013470 [Thalassiosira sp. AJA248-18]
MAMDFAMMENDAGGGLPRHSGNNSKVVLTTGALAVGSSAGESSMTPSNGCSVAASPVAHNKLCLGDVATSFEPLKVCLDDDSSIEDSDDDMFDDDAFTFGDEDFQAIMSHEAMKRMIKPHTPSASPASVAIAAQNSLLPLHQSSSFLSEKDASIAAGPGGVDASLPSTAASSSASLATLTLTSSLTSCTSISKKTRSKRRVSLHNDVAVVPIPMRTEYSNLVRGRIWSSANELYQNAARNTIEFAAEGFDWRNVANDEQMVRSPSGEHIHPIHYMNIANLGCSASSHCQQENRQAEVNSSPVSMEAEPLSS